MKALPLLKHNIDTLLKARGQTRRDLAQWVRQSMDNRKIDPWISHIFTTADAEFQMKYLDRIAEFFGLPVYQLFQPGISHLTERRKTDRRSGRDRRVSAMNQRIRQSLSEAVASLSPDDISDMIRLKALTGPSRAEARKTMLALERSEHQAARPGHKPPAAERDAGGATARKTGTRNRPERTEG